MGNDDISAVSIEHTYQSERANYELYAKRMRALRADILKAKDIKIQTIEYRAKDVSSFVAKSNKLNPDGKKKYERPLEEITDLAGVRIVAYTLGAVQAVCEVIKTEFTIIEHTDLGIKKLSSGEFGYKSIHFIVKIGEKRLAFPEYQQFRNLVCEIQVRTVLQHVWAQIEHGLQYKGTMPLALPQKQRLVSLAGLLEIGDREFEAIEQDAKVTREEISNEAIGDDVSRKIEDKLTDSQNFASIESSLYSDDRSESQGIRVSTLIERGLFKEAIAAFTRKIGDQTRNYTLYLGLAKAKFLVGDLDGAISAIDMADELRPGNEQVARLKLIIQGGYSADVLVLETQKINRLLNEGNQHLRNGRGLAALDSYEQARRAGASRPFSIINEVMALIVAKDYAGADERLDTLTIHPTTFMEINIRTLKLLISCFFNRTIDDDSMNRLTLLLEQLSQYSIQKSPLGLLEEGVENSHLSTEIPPCFRSVIGRLKNSSSGVT